MARILSLGVVQGIVQTDNWSAPINLEHSDFPAGQRPSSPVFVPQPCGPPEVERRTEKGRPQCHVACCHATGRTPALLGAVLLGSVDHTSDDPTASEAASSITTPPLSPAWDVSGASRSSRWRNEGIDHYRRHTINMPGEGNQNNSGVSGHCVSLSNAVPPVRSGGRPSSHIALKPIDRENSKPPRPRPLPRRSVGRSSSGPGVSNPNEKAT